MKKILTFLFATFAIITVKAQTSSDIAIQQGTTASVYKTTSLLTEPATTLVSDNRSEGTAKKGLSIMPNAATKDIKIILVTGKAAEATIEVIDESGKKVLQQSAQLTAGNNNINIDNFHSLNEGTYTIKLISNNETQTSRFLFWK
jgi:hypothetical protein